MREEELMSCSRGESEASRSRVRHKSASSRIALFSVTITDNRHCCSAFLSLSHCCFVGFLLLGAPTFPGTFGPISYPSRSSEMMLLVLVLEVEDTHPLVAVAPALLEEEEEEEEEEEKEDEEEKDEEEEENSWNSTGTYLASSSTSCTAVKTSSAVLRE